MEKVFKNLPRLETGRLILRPVEEQDWAAIYEYTGDAETARYTTWDAAKHPDEAKALVRFILKRYDENKPSNWAVVLKKEEKLIGTCGFTSARMEHKRAEIGYAFRRDCRNRGYATEAVAKTIEFGFNEIGLNRIEAFVDAGNTASQRVLEKCGMKYEGTLRKYIIKNGEYRDMKSYSILSENSV